MDKEKPVEKKNELEEPPFLTRLVYVLIGSIPILVIMGLCMNLIYIDYVKNNYSFFDKSIFLSNIDSHIFETKVDCAKSDVASAAKYLPRTEENKYKKCYTSEVRSAAHSCFRYFNDFLIQETEADLLISLSKKAFALSSKSVQNEGIISFDIFNGQLIINGNSININNYQDKKIFSREEIITFTRVRDKVIQLIKSNFGIDNLYLTKPVLFMRMSSQKDSKSDNAPFPYWNDQIDDITWQPVAVTAIVQLNTYVKEFLGGRFNFRNSDNRTILSVQPKKARVLVYTAGSENEYFTEQMESGEYFWLRLSFTCDSAYQIDLSSDNLFKISD